MEGQYMRWSTLHRQPGGYICFQAEEQNPETPTALPGWQKNMIIFLKIVLLEFSGSTMIKSKEICQQHGTVDFENDPICNPSFNICWEKAKPVNNMTCMYECKKT